MHVDIFFRNLLKDKLCQVENTPNAYCIIIYTFSVFAKHIYPTSFNEGVNSGFWLFQLTTGVDALFVLGSLWSGKMGKRPRAELGLWDIGIKHPRSTMLQCIGLGSIPMTVSFEIEKDYRLKNMEISSK